MSLDRIEGYVPEDVVPFVVQGAEDGSTVSTAGADPDRIHEGSSSTVTGQIEPTELYSQVIQLVPGLRKSGTTTSFRPLKSSGSAPYEVLKRDGYKLSLAGSDARLSAKTAQVNTTAIIPKLPGKTAQIHINYKKT